MYIFLIWTPAVYDVLSFYTQLKYFFVPSAFLQTLTFLCKRLTWNKSNNCKIKFEFVFVFVKNTKERSLDINLHWVNKTGS